MNVEELKILWKEVFGDSDIYLESFFSKIYEEKNTFVHCVNGKIVAALYMVPYDICMGKRQYRIMYLYALATKPEYRRRGIMAGLIHQAHEIGKKRGYIASVLIPASRDLYMYYEKFGYNIIYYQDKLILNKQQIHKKCMEQSVDSKRYTIESLDKPAFQEIYEKYKWNQKNGIRQSKLLNTFYLETLQQEGGEAISICSGGERLGLYALLCQTNIQSEKESGIIIYETNVKNDEERLLLISIIADNYEFQTLEMIGLDNCGNHIFDDYIFRTPYALIYPMSDSNITWTDISINRLLL